MKEFKKWCLSEEGLQTHLSEYAEQEAAWRAALEWFDKAINPCMTVDDVQDVLDIELGD